MFHGFFYFSSKIQVLLFLLSGPLERQSQLFGKVIIN